MDAVDGQCNGSNYVTWEILDVIIKAHTSHVGYGDGCGDGYGYGYG